MSRETLHLELSTKSHHHCYTNENPDDAEQQHLCFALHGYGESGDMMLERLLGCSDRLCIVAPNACHPIYLPNRKGGFSWMTSHDREHQIKNNMRYLEVLWQHWTMGRQWESVTWCGYSQGAQMACRGLFGVGGEHLVSIGAEIPPEVMDAEHSCYDIVSKNRSHVRSTKMVRGHKDLGYAKASWNRDVEWLTSNNIETEGVEVRGAHKWTDVLIDPLEKIFSEIIHNNK